MPWPDAEVRQPIQLPKIANSEALKVIISTRPIAPHVFDVFGWNASGNELGPEKFSEATNLDLMSPLPDHEELENGLIHFDKMTLHRAD